MSRTSTSPSLSEIRRQLDVLVDRRLLGPLSHAESRRWTELTHLEDQMLRVERPERESNPHRLAANGV